MAKRQGSGKGLLIGLLVGGGALTLGCVVCGCVGLIWLGSQDDPGVKLANQMDAEDVEFVRARHGLAPGEAVLAYYDATLTLDGSEAAILTDRRLMYHIDGRTTAIGLAEIIDIRHRNEALIGDVIEVDGQTGTTLRIEIPPLNGGESFHRALQNARAQQGRR